MAATIYSDRTILHDNLYAYRVSERSSWENMQNRCKPAYKERKYYYAKGIKVCSQWTGRNGFLQFYKDMGKKPSHHHSLERINGDKGYEPRNCRWATKHEQSVNRKLQANNISGYRGVSYHKWNKYKQWKACIKSYEIGKIIHLGYFVSPEDAAVAYDCAAVQINGDLAKLNILRLN